MSETPKKGKETCVNWSLCWEIPTLVPSRASSNNRPFPEAEQRLFALVRQAVQHAVVSGKAKITIEVEKSDSASQAQWNRISRARLY